MLNTLLIIYMVIGGMLWGFALAVSIIASSPVYNDNKHIIPLFFLLPVFIFIWPLVLVWLVFLIIRE